MREKSPSARAGPDSQLIARIRRILGDVPGESTRWSPLPASAGPFLSSLGVLAAYAVLWGAIEIVNLAGGWEVQPKLVSLLAWGACYFAAAHFFQQSAVRRLMETVERDIAPHASPAYCARVTEDLERRYGQAISWALPAMVATASTAAAVWAIDLDIEGGEMKPLLLLSPEFIFFALSYFVYFLTAAQAVVAARFYLFLADHLHMETGGFYVLGAAESPLVVGLSRLSGQVMVFWLMLFLTILSSMLLAAPWPDGYAFEPQSKFLLILVPVAGFFSLGFGSLVYLRSEAKIRAVLRRFTHAQLEGVRRQGNALFARYAAASAEDRKALADFADLHDRVVAGSNYGSRLGAILSLVLPLALPIISIVKLIIDT